MNSWEIIKTELTKKTRLGTIGRNIEIIKCAELFVKILHNLTDKEVAMESMNNDDECRKSLLALPIIKELTEIGVIS